jgi:hypothetical protein
MNKHIELKKLFEKVRHKPNVIGFSRKLQPRLRKGQLVPNEPYCLRIYVSKKLPLNQLRAEDVIPSSIDGIPTDVIEIGELKALVDKTKKFRPVIFGISIGNIQITAGTNGFLFVDKKGEKYFGSNAHVFVDNPSKEPKDVDVKDIIQPGKYDGGTIDDKVAEYVWHKRLIPSTPSTCPIAKLWAGIYNTIAKILKSKTRLIPIVEAVNRIDFAVAKPVTDYEVKFPDFDYTNHKFVGLGFAGSNLTSVVCKVKYIVEEGYKPFNVDTVEVKEGDTVCKTGRTSCFTTAKVIDSSSHVRVNYDSFEAEFDDVVLTTKLLEAGDSGSSVWL